MGEALIAGVIQSGLLTPREILFHEPRLDRAKYLQEKFEVTPVDSNSRLPPEPRLSSWP